MVARVKCESEWNVIGVFLIDQFVGHGGGPLERQKQDSHVLSKNWRIASDSLEKSESSLDTRRGLIEL